jgi:hypothetical protein
MNIYLVDRNSSCGYDEWDSFVCVAESEDAARHTHPDSCNRAVAWDGIEFKYGGWVNASQVKVTLLGQADPTIPAGVVCSSFNAG